MLVLCAGDLHLGRRSSRLPAAVATGPDADTLACAHAWRALVDHAIARQVDLVALSGDLVDRKNRYFEARGPLEEGIKRLAAAGIRTVAVAGNHDHDVLPLLARALPPEAFTLLGAGGTWERCTIERRGLRLHVDGWSFAAEHVRDNPLAAYRPTDGDGAPVLGLLHCELDAPAGQYAPVPRAALHATDVAFWLLGHVHAPDVMRSPTGGAPLLYPGSPQAMDPGEPGAHGAWEVVLCPGVPVAPTFVPLSTVHYAAFDVDASGAASIEEVWARVGDAVRREGEARAATHGRALRHVSCRVRLVGATPLHRRLAAAGSVPAEEIALAVDDATAHVERVEVATRPARDLVALAQGSGAPALVVRLLLDARRAADGTHAATDDPLLAAVLADAATATSLVRGAPAYAPLPAGDDVGSIDAADGGRASLLALVERQGALLLDELLAQQEGA